MELEFKPVVAGDIDRLRPFYGLRPNKTCDSVFLDSFLWKDYYHVQCAVSEGRAVLWLMEKDGQVSTAMPLCREEDLPYFFQQMVDYFSGVLHKPFYISLADEEAVQCLNLDPALFEVEEQVDLKDYLTEDEQAAFVPGYITEGDFDGSGSIKIFPVAKSTELMFFNDTDWQRFSKDTFVRYGALSTMEGVTAVAEQYYNWSGGRALFGRDAMANYMIVGAKQLGCEIFEVHNGKMTLHFDHDVVRKLWDNYYVPFVKGYFVANGRFRSDDVKTGALLGCVSSCASATFFPKQVMPGDNQIHDIEMKVLPAPRFAGGEKVAVQQGAGMVVTTGTEAEINGAVTFLKWFTEPQNNIAFSVESGYLPVTIAANDMDAIRASGLELTDNMEQILSGAVKTVRENELYTPTVFAGGTAARKILEYSMGDQAIADRDTVLKRIAAGQSAEAATAEFLTDDYFETWYQATLAQLQQYEG